jgi:thiosulfate dehydrogenase [quinone] large subunit
VSGPGGRAGGWTSATVPAAALLPLRFFAGATFLYAGLDKLLDPRFFDATSPASIYAQLAAFTRTSPIASLVRVAEPFALPMGLLIALAEIAIGLGALSGLAFRLAALGGALLSLLFWLTASWSTHPYYYGPDLPYAAGWIVLALAGHGDLLVPRRVLEMGSVAASPRSAPRPDGRTRAPVGRRAVEVGAAPSPERRVLLQAAVLAVASLAVGSLAVPLRLFRHESDAGETAFGGSLATAGHGAAPSPTSASSAPPSQPPATSAVPRSGLTVASISDVERRGAFPFTVPFDAPSPLPAGDPGVIVKLANGSFVAYDATCTHEGCTVEWDARDSVLLCPCHGAAFDPSDHAAVLAGPTDQPLAALPINVDKASGRITLRA